METPQHDAMKRRDFLSTVACGAVGVAAGTTALHGEESSVRKPNVIFAFSDEHRWHSMSLSGMPGLQTPNMVQMAEQGVSFTNCISNYPVCSPYRAILMTGRWPYQQGVIDNAIKLKPREMTLGKAFKGAGYTTGYVGKWHLGGARAEPYGFDLSLV
ncbi:MAG: sulfatase-like hydrolase/transferase, partial [Lentisphaerae bacterium]|nr:sulfatase-like hydrolase/transferase [Lentisphaerota bacterium]